MVSTITVVCHRVRGVVTNQIAIPVTAITKDGDSDWWLKITM